MKRLQPCVTALQVVSSSGVNPSPLKPAPTDSMPAAAVGRRRRPPSLAEQEKRTARMLHWAEVRKEHAKVIRAREG